MSARPSLLACLALPLALSACNAADAPPADPPLANSAIKSEYTLVNKAGETVEDEDFAGRYQMIYFGYAFCPNVCPFDVQRMMRGYDLFAEENPDLAAKVQPIFITVDPERDTPEKVGEFTSAFSDDLIGLTGTPEQIAAVADSFAFSYARVEPVAGGEYDMQHPSIGYLVDPDGEPMALIPVEQSPEAVAAELETWVR